MLRMALDATHAHHELRLIRETLANNPPGGRLYGCLDALAAIVDDLVTEIEGGEED